MDVQTPPPMWPEDVVMAGVIRKYKTKKRRLQKGFRCYFFVLHKASESGLNKLSYYNSESNFKCNDPEVGSISLENCLGIRFVRLGGVMDRCAFQLSASIGSIVLGTNMPEYSARWVEALRLVAFGKPQPTIAKATSSNPASSQFKFDVQIKPTDDSKRIGLASSGQLSVFPLTLKLEMGDDTSVTWPITGLRRYARTPLMSELLIEAGRRCGPQQGTYVFISNDFSAMYDIIRKYANELANESTIPPRKKVEPNNYVDPPELGYHHLDRTNSSNHAAYQEPDQYDHQDDIEGSYQKLILEEKVYDLGDEYLDISEVPDKKEDANYFDVPLLEDEHEYDDVLGEEDAAVEYDNSSYAMNEPAYEDLRSFSWLNAQRTPTKKEGDGDASTCT
eukprot:m.105750 g.105750  ORF g.105750 m.105750 type:complete len:391 (-) comp9137_c0_seq1:295-1467(-)